jgi:hypothetical protein
MSTIVQNATTFDQKQHISTLALTPDQKKVLCYSEKNSRCMRKVDRSPSFSKKES